MIYTSVAFREKHPAVQERIGRSAENGMVTYKLMYTIMDLAGVKSVNGISYISKSILK